MDSLRDIIRAGRQLYLPLQDWAIEHYGKLARRGNYIRERIECDDPLADVPSAAIYVHFDKNGVVHDYVMQQLHELVGAGYRITFVSNSPELPAETCMRVRPLCKELIWRYNTGYDFGAYKDGIASIADLDRLDSLVLMNDSIYGPFWNLRDILAKVDTSSVDFWGIVDSFENCYHIQSFFLLFMPNAVLSPAFKNFWHNLPYIDHRMWVIRNAEVKLTQELVRAQLKSGVLAPYDAVAATVKRKLSRIKTLPKVDRVGSANIGTRSIRDGALNPMHFFWDVLITDYACPFIKRDLLTSNPSHVPDIMQWQEIIAMHSNYDVRLISRHLER